MQKDWKVPGESSFFFCFFFSFLLLDILTETRIDMSRALVGKMARIPLLPTELNALEQTKAFPLVSHVLGGTWAIVTIIPSGLFYRDGGLPFNTHPSHH